MTDPADDPLMALLRQVTTTETALVDALRCYSRYTQRLTTAKAHLARHAALASRHPTDPQALKHLANAQRRWRRIMLTSAPDVGVARAAFETAVVLLYSASERADGGAA